MTRPPAFPAARSDTPSCHAETWAQLLMRTIDIKQYEDLLPPGAQPGTVPTDAEQSTGLERLEILGKMQGVDIFDMRPLDASRLGTSRNTYVLQDER